MDTNETEMIRRVQAGNWPIFHNPFPAKTTQKIASDGGSTDYYILPEGAVDLNDLIEAKSMSFARGNIFKALYRMGEKAGVDQDYDINKIILFAERLKVMRSKGLPI